MNSYQIKRPLKDNQDNNLHSNSSNNQDNNIHSNSSNNQDNKIHSDSSNNQDYNFLSNSSNDQDSNFKIQDIKDMECKEIKFNSSHNNNTLKDNKDNNTPSNNSNYKDNKDSACKEIRLNCSHSNNTLRDNNTPSNLIYNKDNNFKIKHKESKVLFLHNSIYKEQISNMEIIKYRIFKQILTVKNVMEQDLKKKKVKKSLVLNVTKKLENVLNVLEADGITKKI